MRAGRESADAVPRSRARVRARAHAAYFRANLKLRLRATLVFPTFSAPLENPCAMNNARAGSPLMPSRVRARGDSVFRANLKLRLRATLVFSTFSAPLKTHVP